MHRQGRGGRHPAAHPSARYYASMADDTATGNVVLFGGLGPFADTWTWG